MRIDWSLLQNCLSLKQLAITHLYVDVRKWVNEYGRNVQDFIATGISDPQWREFGKEFEHLVLPQLSMLFTFESPTVRAPKRDSNLSTDDFESGPISTEIDSMHRGQNNMV